MTQTKLSQWLKRVILVVAGLGICIHFIGFPIVAVEMRSMYPEYREAFWPWLIFLWTSAIPCYMVLCYGWKISTNIGKNCSFSMENADALQKISAITVTDCIYFVLGNMTMLILGWNHPGIAIALMMIPAFGFCIAVAAACLSHLVLKAAKLQEENDLTI